MLPSALSKIKSHSTSKLFSYEIIINHDAVDEDCVGDVKETTKETNQRSIHCIATINTEMIICFSETTIDDDTRRQEKVLVDWK